MKNQTLEKPPKNKSGHPEKLLKSEPSVKTNPNQEKPTVKIFTLMKI